MTYSSIEQSNGNLRIHQIDAKDKIFKSWDEFTSVMLQMPTGTGKTFLFTSLISDLLNHYKSNCQEINILVVAHRTELLDQISSSLTRYGIPHGFIQGNREQYLWQRVQVGSVMSLLTDKNIINVKRLRFDYIIIDEAHHSLADSYKRLFEIFPNAKKLGVTATPWRLNHETFYSLYQTLITTPQISWFIKKGLLADFDYVSIKPDSKIQNMINNTEVSQTGDFVNVELDRAFNTPRIRSRLFASYREFAEGKKGIVYAINKEHALNIATMYCNKGVKAIAIDSDTPKDERKYWIEAFKRDEVKVLVNIDIFTEGFDCPNVCFIQLARPAKSLSLYLQQVGRGLRIVEGKEKTIILDNVGLYNYFGLPDANRHWQHHFKGHDFVDEAYNVNGSNKLSDGSKENSYEEDDELMMTVRGASSKDQVESIKPNIEKEEQLTIIEFYLCDYYLIRGNRKSFKVYSLLKKKGKITGAISNVIFEYEDHSMNLNFTFDIKHNFDELAKIPKAQMIIMFASSLIGLNLKDVLNVHNLIGIEKMMQPKVVKLFDLLLFINDIYTKKDIMENQ